MQKSHLAKFNTDSCLRQFIKFILDTSLRYLYININLKHFCHHLFFHATNIVDYKVHLDEENRKASLDNLEKEMSTHCSVLAWRIPGMGEPGGLLSMGLHKSWMRLKRLSSSSREKQT